MIEYDDLVRDGRMLLEVAATDIANIERITLERGVDHDSVLAYTQRDAWMMAHEGFLRLPKTDGDVVLSAMMLRAAISSAHHRGILTGVFLGRAYL